MAKKYYGDKMSKGHANMPQQEVMKDYPKQDYGSLGVYKDDIQGVDMFGRENRKRLERQKKN